MHYESIQKKSIISLRAPKPKYFFIHNPALPVTVIGCINFFASTNTHIKTMSSQASSPASPASITEEISTRTMSDVVKDFNTEELIDYLGRKDLKLDEDDIKILRKEKIAGRSFLRLTEEKLERYGMKGGPATVLVEFIEGLSQKLRNYSSLKTLDDLKEMLRRNKVNGEDITNIKQFTPGR